MNSGRQRFGALGIFISLFLLFLYLPIALLILFSFNDGIYLALPIQGFTLDWYSQLADNGPMLAALLNSLKLAAIVSVVSTTLGLLAAKGLTREKLPGRRMIEGAMMLPLLVPAIVVGLALLIFARHFLDLRLSLWTVGAGHVLITTPFAMLVLNSRLEGFDRSLEEASLDLGETAFSTFWRVTVPLALPGVVASLLLCFTISFDEIVLAFYLSGNQATLPVFIFSQLRFPNALPMVLALASCILTVSCLLVIGAELVRRIGAPADNERGLP